MTPRQTRIFRVPDLQSFQCVLSSLIPAQDPFLARSCAVLVPSRAAAGQLRDTLETLALAADSGPGAARAFPLPDLLTRGDWYQRLHERLRGAPPLLNEFEREVLMGAAAREAADAGARPPFTLRPALVAEIVRLYEDVHRLRKTVDHFERLLVQELEIDAESDRGAAQLLQQTVFLANTFRQYEDKLSKAGRIDEHRLRGWLLEHPVRQAYTHVIVAVADRVAERGGLWPADFDLLTRLPQLTRIDVVATEALLAAGFHERVHEMLPGIEVEAVRPDTGHASHLSLLEQTAQHPRLPVLMAPGPEDNRPYFQSRDREDELSDIARRLTQSPRGRRSLSRTAIVFKRPLPYMYLARAVFGSAGIPHQTLDALPLAAEPAAAAIDLVFDCVSSGFSRTSTIALLGSPHFSFNVVDRPPTSGDIAAFDRKLRDAGYLGGLDRLRQLVDEWEGPSPGASDSSLARAHSVASVALTIAEQLAPLLSPGTASSHLDCLCSFLRQHDRAPAIDDPLCGRQLRASAAIRTAIMSLREAYRGLDDPLVDSSEIFAGVRRWIEGQTFAPRTGASGVHLVDAEAARFGLFDEVCLVGLVDTEWPDRASRNVFFPPFLLQQYLGWPAESDRLLADRAAFRDLLRLARDRFSVSTFSLEDDAIVGPSVYLEELEPAGLEIIRVSARAHTRIFPDEAISVEPIAASALSATSAAWLALRQSRTDSSAPAFHGVADAHQRPPHSISALETYLECPFKFFAKHVLKLDEELNDEEARRPRIQGIFLHRVFQAFFQEWSRIGRGAITLETLPQARTVFARVVAPLLAELTDTEAALERNRLFGTAAAEGLAEIVFRIEAESGAPVIERLIEYRFGGEFEVRAADGPRRVALTGIADRLDLLEDGSLRVIDYKSSRAPSPKRMLQVPVYSVCATQQLDGRHGRAWRVGKGGYIAFRDPSRFVPIGDRGDLEPALRDAQERLLTAIDGMAAGQFPPDPTEPFRCSFCSYSGVCRKDYVGDE